MTTCRAGGDLFRLRGTELDVLCAAWSTGFVLENVQIKVDAFDYLLLPVDVSQGCVGRLEVQVSLTCRGIGFLLRVQDQASLLNLHSMQVPWRNLGARPVVVELSDVYLEVRERPESHWEEDAATLRRIAAKRATLASKELEQLSKPLLTRQQDGQEGRGSSWWLASRLGQLLLNRLNLSVKNVHFRFQVSFRRRL